MNSTSEAAAPSGGWQRRYSIVFLCFLAVFVCYIDRVNISVAIIPMAKELQWSASTQGAVHSGSTTNVA